MFIDKKKENKNDYLQFKKEIVKTLKDRLKDLGRVELYQVNKNNGVFLEALTIKVDGENISPSFYLDDFYNLYLQGHTTAGLAEVIYLNWESHRIKEGIDTSFFSDFAKIRPFICYRLIHYQRNEEMLKEHPHIKMMDLAMVFYYRVPKEILEGANVLVRKSDIKRWGISREELLKIANENTPGQMPYKIVAMDDFLMGKVEWEERIDYLKTESSMYILSNKEQFYGAAAIFYPNLLKNISHYFKTNLYILPSSIHETILIPDREEYSKADLENMVREVNKTQLSREEILSDKVYYYDSKTEKLRN
ncbi:MAG TPA: DUF5688 family protein [Lachnospiraceae bacterium]